MLILSVRDTSRGKRGGHIHSEFTNFDLSTHEHTVIFAARRWWATFSWAYQVYSHGVDATVPSNAHAEETRNEYRLKIGLNL